MEQEEVRAVLNAGNASGLEVLRSLEAFGRKQLGEGLHIAVLERWSRDPDQPGYLLAAWIDDILDGLSVEVDAQEQLSQAVLEVCLEMRPVPPQYHLQGWGQTQGSTDAILGAVEMGIDTYSEMAAGACPVASDALC